MRTLSGRWRARSCARRATVCLRQETPEAALVFHDYREEVQLLLTDVVLPDRSGCDLALELLTLGGGLRALLVSGYPENSVTRKGLGHLGCFYLPKPFSAAALLHTVKEVLSAR